MEVILKEDIKGVGKKGEIITVKEGYAKNFLFPGKKAVIATDGEKRKIESEKDNEKKKEEKMKDEYRKISAVIENKEITMKVKAGKDGKIFGSITHKDIGDEIEKKFNIKIDKKKIILSEEHIKKIGSYTAEVKFLSDIKAKVKVNVEGE